jgi:hypothetical protein
MNINQNTATWNYKTLHWKSLCRSQFIHAHGSHVGITLRKEMKLNVFIKLRFVRYMCPCDTLLLQHRFVKTLVHTYLRWSILSCTIHTLLLLIYAYNLSPSLQTYSPSLIPFPRSSQKEIVLLSRFTEPFSKMFISSTLSQLTFSYTTHFQLYPNIYYIRVLLSIHLFLNALKLQSNPVITTSVNATPRL